MERDHTIIELPPGNDLLEMARQKQVALTSKYIVIRCSASDRFVFGSVIRFPYHANLIDKFCHLNDIAGGWEKRPDLYAIFDLSCNVLGGGWLEYQPDGNLINLYGASTAYGRFDHQAASHMLAGDRRFSGYQYVISD